MAQMLNALPDAPPDEELEGELEEELTCGAAE
jgi:hypothetical protein